MRCKETCQCLLAQIYLFGFSKKLTSFYGAIVVLKGNKKINKINSDSTEFSYLFCEVERLFEVLFIAYTLLGFVSRFVHKLRKNVECDLRDVTLSSPSHFVKKFFLLVNLYCEVLLRLYIKDLKADKIFVTLVHIPRHDPNQFPVISVIVNVKIFSILKALKTERHETITS